MTTEERLEKLERELSAAKRRNCWLLVVVGLAVVGVGLAWTLTKTTPTAQAQGSATKPAKTVICANKFILEDAGGKPCAWLSADEDMPALVLCGKKGKIRVMLAIGKNGPILALSGEKGKNGTGLLGDTGTDTLIRW